MIPGPLMEFPGLLDHRHPFSYLQVQEVQALAKAQLPGGIICS